MHEIALKLRRPLRGLVASDALGAALARPAERDAVATVRKDQEASAQQREALRRETEQARRAAEELKRLISRLETAAAELEAARQAFLREAPSAVVELSLAIAERLVHAKFSTTECEVDGVVRGALERLGERGGVVVYLNPEDLKAMEANRGEKRGASGQAIDNAATLRWVADGSLQRGDCRVEGGDLTVRSNWGEQLQRLGADLLRASAATAASD